MRYKKWHTQYWNDEAVFWAKIQNQQKISLLSWTQSNIWKWLFWHLLDPYLQSANIWYSEWIHTYYEWIFHCDDDVSDIRRGMTSAMTNTGQKKENDNIIWHFLFFKQAFWTVFQIPKVLQSFFILQPDFFVWPLRWGLEILMPVWSWWHIWCQESQPAWGTAQLPKCTTVPTCSHKVLLLVQEDLQHFNAVW